MSPEIADYIAISVIWYVIAGLYRLGEDVFQPPFNQPAYVREKRIGMMVFVVFLWPVVVIRLLLLKRRFTGKSVLGSFLWGCALLGGLFLWVRASYGIVENFVEAVAFRALLTVPVVWLVVFILSKFFGKPRAPRT